MSLLQAENLAIGYEGRPVAENISFSVNAGDYLCIVGENGAGKSTLIRTLLHLQVPLSGHISVSDEIGRQEIGYLPQQTLIQRDFPASVREIVLSGCQGRCGRRPFYNKKEKQLAEDTMRRFGLDQLAARCYRELSGGQQQRVLLARALCAAGKLLLMDEPAAGLDPKVSAQMYDTIRTLNDEGITIIMISHDLQAALQYASHILHIGDRVFFGTKEEYVSDDIGALFLRTQRGGEPA